MTDNSAYRMIITWNYSLNGAEFHSQIHRKLTKMLVSFFFVFLIDWLSHIESWNTNKSTQQPDFLIRHVTIRIPSNRTDERRKKIHVAKFNVCGLRINRRKKKTRVLNRRMFWSNFWLSTRVDCRYLTQVTPRTMSIDYYYLSLYIFFLSFS